MRLTLDINSLDLTFPSLLSGRVVIYSRSFAALMLGVGSVSSFTLMRNRFATPLFTVELESLK